MRAWEERKVSDFSLFRCDHHTPSFATTNSRKNTDCLSWSKEGRRAMRHQVINRKPQVKNIWSLDEDVQKRFNRSACISIRPG